MRFFEELACGDLVADRGCLGDAEDGGEVERVGTVRERLLELPVDPQPLQRARESLQDFVRHRLGLLALLFAAGDQASSISCL